MNLNLQSENFRRTRVQFLVFVVSLLLSLWFNQQGWLERLEFAIYDVRQTELRADTVINDQIKVVLIDEYSLSFMSDTLGAFPWPRTIYAELIDFFQQLGAKAVLFDVLFSEPDVATLGASTDVSVHDLRLAQATGDFPGTIHAALMNRDVYGDSTDLSHQNLPDYAIEQFAMSPTMDVDDQLNTFALPIDLIAREAPYIGVVGVDPDSDGVYRRVKPVWEYQGYLFPAFSFAPVLIDQPDVLFLSEEHALQVNELRIPLDERNRLLVNFYGNMNAISIGSVLQAWDMWNMGELENLPVDPYEFENAIVYIGASAIGLDDVKAITNDPKAPGVYIHASAMSNILSDDVLKPATARDTILITAIATLMSVVLAFNVPFYLLKIVLLVGLPYGYWLLTGWQLTQNVQMVFTVPVMGFALGWSWSFTYLSFTEGASKRRVKRMLSQYVSEAMLNEVLERPDDILHAGDGKTETLTILFSDVRGFTKISESLPAEQVVKLLNCHFGEMAESIFENQGTLDKFIGDAIMAYWGMPIKVNDHADLAVKAAMDMVDALLVVNSRLNEMELPSIEIGIGLNTGKVVLGNIGSDRKLDYTVIGDSVNVASRMEGITKMYGVPIVVSEPTRMATTTPRPYVLLDHVRVKGKTEPMAIFTPLPDQKESPDQWHEHLKQSELSQRAFGYYQTQQWDKAEELYKLLELNPVRAIFLSRILEFRRHPPPPNWDGVYTFTSK
jgi:adenylate cyclase